MNASGAVLLLVARRTARRSAVTSVVAIAAAGGAMAALPPIAGSGDLSTPGLVLHVPCCLLAATAFASAIEAWPLLSRDRHGRDAVDRLGLRCAEGSLAASAGALIVLAMLLALSGLIVAAAIAWRGSGPAAARERIEFIAIGSPWLDHVHRRVELRANASAELCELRLNPLVALGPNLDYAPLPIAVRDGDTALHERPLSIAGSHERIDIAFAARHLDRISIEATAPGGLSVLWTRGTVEGVLATPHSVAMNAAVAALSYLLPTALALALACVLRRHVTTALLLGGGVLALLASTCIEWAPHTRVIAALCDERWILGAGDLRAPVLTGAIATALLAAMACLPQRRAPRRW